MTYEIVILEVVEDNAKLAGAERWWIAYGKACGWPLTNCTAGGGMSETALAERAKKQFLKDEKKRHAAVMRLWRRMRRQRSVWSPESHAAESEYRKRQVMQLMESEQGLTEEPPWNPFEAEQRCLQLIEKHLGSPDMFFHIVIEARVTSEFAHGVYERWLSHSHERGKRALEEDRRALYERLKAGKS